MVNGAMTPATSLETAITVLTQSCGGSGLTSSLALLAGCLCALSGRWLHCATALGRGGAPYTWHPTRLWCVAAGSDEQQVLLFRAYSWLLTWSRLGRRRG